MRLLIIILMLLFAAGFLELSFNSMAQTLVQLNAPVGLRGRVIGLFNMASLGLRAFSGVSVGLVGSLIGVHVDWNLTIVADSSFTNPLTQVKLSDWVNGQLPSPGARVSHASWALLTRWSMAGPRGLCAPGRAACPGRHIAADEGRRVRVRDQGRRDPSRFRAVARRRTLRRPGAA